jgi:hypothetical protein
MHLFLARSRNESNFFEKILIKNVPEFIKSQTMNTLTTPNELSSGARTHPDTMAIFVEKLNLALHSPYTYSIVECICDL